MAELSGRPWEILVQGKNYAHVAVPAPNGTVHTVITYAHGDDRGNVLLNSVDGRVWARYLRLAGKATVTLLADGNPSEYVSIRCTLIDARSEGADADIDMLAEKYLGLDSFPYGQPGERRVTFILRPDRVRHQG